MTNPKVYELITPFVPCYKSMYTDYMVNGVIIFSIAHLGVPITLDYKHLTFRYSVTCFLQSTAEIINILL